MNPIELLLSKLPDAKRQGKEWVCLCPGHQDGRPSLSISEGDGGRALIHCHAGCPPEQILAALGLKLADLMPPTSSYSSAKPKPKAPAPRPSKTFSTAAEAVADLERYHGPRSTQWTYHNAQGEPTGLIIRWSLPNGKKKVLPVSLVDGKWINGGMPPPRPIYNLPDLLKRPGETVYIAEGEKCADALAGLGYLATTSPHGSQSAAKADWAALAGRDSVIVPDHDGPGADYAQDVAGILSKLSPPGRVRIIDLRGAWPDLPNGGDIADILQAGESPESIKTKLAALVNAADPETPAPPAPPLRIIDPFEPFPVDALPELLRGFVLELAAATGNDPACAALAALVTIAGAIGNRVAAIVKKGWTEPAILWGANVARSGTIKSVVLKLATRPIIELFKESRQQYAADLENFQNERGRYEVERDRWKSAQKKGAGPSDPPAEPTAPKEKRLLVSDVTCEKLGVLLQDNPMGLILYRDELAAWVGAFDRYAAGGKGSDAPTWLSFFDAAPVVIDRKSAAGTIFVDRASISVLGSIQPGTLRRIFGAAERESGLLARLLLVFPPPQPGLWTDEELSDNRARDWENLLRALMEIQPGVDEQDQPRPRLIPLADDAKPVYIAWHNAHMREVHNIPADDLAAHFAKLKGNCIRVALLLACVDAVTHGGALAAISREHIERAIGITEWFKNEARRVYSMMGEGDGERETRQLVQWIERKDGAVTPRDLQQNLHRFKSDASAAEAALEELVEAGYGRWEHIAPSEKGGRPSKVFHLTPPPTPTQPSPDSTKPPTESQKPGSVDVGNVGGDENNSKDRGVEI